MLHLLTTIGTNMNLSSEGISMHPAEKEDVSFIVKCANEKGLLYNRRTKRKTHTLSQQRQVSELYKKPDYNLFVIHAFGSRHGLCELTGIDLVHRSCDMSLYFEDRAEKVPQYGLGSLKVICSYIFNTLGLNKITVNVSIEDVVMLNLYKNSGFQVEVRKRHHHYSGGSYKTVIEMSILREEYEMQK